MKQYDAFWTCEELDQPDYILIQNDMELAELLDYVGMPNEWKKDITGAIVISDDWDYEAVFLSEDSRYYDLSARYFPLPFYRMDDLNSNLPVYWLESNPYYHK